MNQEFDNSKEELISREKFYSSLCDWKISGKEYEHVLKVWNKLEMKMIKCYQELYLKYDVLILTDVFVKLRNNSLKNNSLSIMSKSLFEPTRFKLGCNA